MHAHELCPSSRAAHGTHWVPRQLDMALDCGKGAQIGPSPIHPGPAPWRVTHLIYYCIRGCQQQQRAAGSANTVSLIELLP